MAVDREFVDIVLPPCPLLGWLSGPFGSFGCPLAPFGRPLGPFGARLGSFWLHLGCLGIPLAVLEGLLGLPMGALGHLLDLSKSRHHFPSKWAVSPQPVHKNEPPGILPRIPRIPRISPDSPDSHKTSLEQPPFTRAGG